MVKKNEIPENNFFHLFSSKTNGALLVNVNEGEMFANVLEALKKAKKLRTIYVSKDTFGFDIGNAFKENKRLRVLDLSGYPSKTEASTSSIGGLKHLRYLHVRHGACFPKGIGRLSFLQTLRHFNVGDKKKKRNASVIEELEGLNLLTGDLSINHLQNVTSGIDACRANLKEKKNLRGLKLTWDWRDDDANNNHEVVLEGLRPHPNLRTLYIDGFEGSKLPRWIEDSSCLPNLVQLTLGGGMYEQLAGFGVLPSLGDLFLWRVRELECIGNELYYSAATAAAGGSSSTTTVSTGEVATTTTTTAFPSLKRLTLQLMQSLKEWVVPPPSTTTCFPMLEEIFILGCPLLTTITPTTTIFPSLKVLHLHRMHGRAAKTLVTNNLNSLTSLTLHFIPNLISLPRQGLMENNNTLLSLEISYCREFKGFLPTDKDDDDDVSSSSSSSSSLQSLKLYACPALMFYPNIRSLTSLRKLEIQECKISKSLQDELTCLSSSSLEHLEHVKILKNKTATTEEEEVVFEWRKSSSFKE